MKKLVFCALAAAVVAQIWGMISWMVLPWHNLDFRQFANDSSIAEVLNVEQQGSGIYLIPNMDPKMHDKPGAMAEWNDKARRGPFAFISLRAEGIEPGMAVPMGIGFVLNFLIAAILFWLVGNSSISCPKGRTIFIAVAGSVGSLYPHISNWSWWHFPAIYCFVGVIDLFVTWALAGFVMVKLYDKLSAQ